MFPTIAQSHPQGHLALLDAANFRPLVTPKPLATPVERFLAHHRIRHFRAGQTKQQAFPNRGRNAAEFAFIQLNPAQWLNFLVVDVDRDDALMCVMHPAVPEPTWIIENEATGHAQAGWAIEPVYLGPDARPHPIRYATAVQQALDRLVDADPGFTRHLVRNPAAHHPAGRVWWGNRTTPWTLGELKAHMSEWVDPHHDELLDGPQPSAWQPAPTFTGPTGIPRPPVATTATEVGRNNAIFRATRRWLWDQWHTRHQAPTHAASYEHARALNDQLPDPLPEGELRCLARSAVRQVNAGKGRPTATSRSDASHEYLAAMGRRGGQARSTAKTRAAQANASKARTARTAALQELRATAAELRAAGATYKTIATAVGRTVRTVITWLKTTPTAAETTPTPQSEILQATGSDASPSSGQGSSRAPARGPASSALHRASSAPTAVTQPPRVPLPCPWYAPRRCPAPRTVPAPPPVPGFTVITHCREPAMP